MCLLTQTPNVLQAPFSAECQTLARPRQRGACGSDRSCTCRHADVFFTCSLTPRKERRLGPSLMSLLMSFSWKRGRRLLFAGFTRFPLEKEKEKEKEEGGCFRGRKGTQEGTPQQYPPPRCPGPAVGQARPGSGGGVSQVPLGPIEVGGPPPFTKASCPIPKRCIAEVPMHPAISSASLVPRRQRGPAIPVLAGNRGCWSRGWGSYVFRKPPSRSLTVCSAPCPPQGLAGPGDQ